MDRKNRRILFSLVSIAIGSLLTSNVHPCSVQSSEQRTVDLNNPAVPFSRDDTMLQIRGSKLEVNGELLFSVDGFAAGHVIWFYSPSYGRFIFSTKPHPKYEFRLVDVLDEHRIVFESDGKRFEWTLTAPLVETGTISNLWMMHDRHPEPLKDKPNGGGETGASSHYEYLLPLDN